MHNYRRTTAKCLLILGVLLVALTQAEPVRAQSGKIGINTQNPTETLDVNGKIRIRQGAKQGYLLSSDSSGSASWINPAKVIRGTGILCITDFGAIGDGTTDNTTAIRKAIDSVAFLGGALCIPYGMFRITGTLTLPAGVKLVGSGTGSTMTGTPYNGSVIRYSGNSWAIRITGSGAGITNLTVYNENNSGAAGGIALEGNAGIVESCHLSDVLISGFADGTALELKAISSGGITYCTFDNIRIRHAKTGIHIVQDHSSFVNSNTFNHGAISGGGFDYCLHVESGNNNTFYGLVMEPYTSRHGHLVVAGGSITAKDIRIEGNSQLPSDPIIEFKPGTYGSVVDGLFGGGLVLNQGDNAIHLRSGKATGVKDAGYNLFFNPGFKGLDQNLLPGWTITGSAVTLEMLAPEVLPDHGVLKITVPAGAVADLKPEPTVLPVVLQTPRYRFCNFGFHVRTSVPGIVATTFNAPTGLVTSAFHPGDGNWHFTGMTAGVSPSQPVAPVLHMDNSGQSTELEVYVTVPAFSFGQVNPDMESKPITSAGGIIHGTISTSLSYVQSSGLLQLPKEGNVFIISGTAAITRINHQAAGRFPKGTVITLLFDNSGCTVSSNPYLLLKSAYISVSNSSLTLISMGDGTWRELQRNL